MHFIPPRARRPLFIALLLAWWLACWFATGAWFGDEAQEVYRAGSLKAEHFVAEASTSFNRIIKSRQGGPRVLARDVTIQHVLTRFAATGQLPQANEADRRARWSADPELAHINRELKLAASDMGLDVLWLLDANGYCLSASNADSAKSIVGTYYGDREDFRTARLGRSGYQVNVGKKMGTTGLAYSAPVIAQGRFIGVVSGGNALTPFANLLDQANGILSDHNGVVMLSHDPSFMLQTLPGSQVNRLDAAARQVLYQRTEFKPLSLTPAQDDRFPELVHVPGQEAPALLRSQSVADGGLSVNVLWPMPQLATLAQQRRFYAGALGTLGTLLMLLASVYASRRREQRTTALALAQRQQQTTQAHNFLDQIVNAIADPIFVKDREHRWVLVNQAFCKIHGQPRENFIGKSARDVFPEPIAQRIWDADERVLTAGIEIVVEEKLTDSQGVTHIVVTKKEPYTDAAGQCFIVGVISDISERKQGERLMRAREREFRSLAENLPDNVVRWDKQGRYIYVNPTNERTIGARSEDVFGKRLGEAFPDGRFNPFETAIDQIVATGQCISLVRQPVQIENGEMRFHEVSLAPEFDDAGHVVSVLGIGRDMTDIYRMQEALAAREQEFRSLAENLPVGVIRYDSECRRRYLNPSAQRMLHGSTADLLGLVPGGGGVPASPAMIGQYRGKMEEVLATDTARELDVFVMDMLPADQQAYYEVRFVPEHGADGEPSGLLAICYDITDRKVHEAALRQSERMLQEAQRIAHVGSWDVDMVNDRLVWSDETFRIWEIDKTQFKADFAAFMETVHPQDRESLTQAYSQAILNHSIYEVEHRLLFPDGRVKHILERGEPQYDAQGTPVRFIGTSMDITERKRLESVLTQREAEFRTLAENSPDPIYRYDRECRRLYVNPVVGRIVGKPVEELIGTTPADGAILISEQSRKLMESVRGVFDSGDSGHIDLDFIAPDGQHRDYHMLLVPECDASGQVATVLAMARDITDIRDAERRLTNYVANFPGFAFSFRLSSDGHASFPFVSPGIERLYGLRPQDVKNDMAPLHALAHPEDRPRTEAAIAESARAMTPFHIETRVCRPGLPERWIETRSIPLREADGSIVWHGLMIDITERKEIEDALLRNQKRLAEAQHIGQMGSWSWDVVGDRVEWSEMAYEIYTPDKWPVDLTFEDFKSSLHPDDLERVVAAVQSAFEHDTPFDFEHRVVSDSKGVRTVHAQGNVFRDADGKPVRMLGTVQDITERKRMEDALHVREQEFRSLVENSPDAVFRYDLDCRRIYVNPAVERIAGIPAAILLGKTPIEGLIGDINLGEKQLTCIQQVLSTGVPTEIELAWVHADGAPQQFHMHFVPEYGRDGQVSSVLAVGRDISARKLAEERLRKSHDILRALAAHQETEHEKERQELAYQIHEDLAQNLAALRLNISLFEMSGESAPRAPLLKTMHDIADSSIVRIRDIVSMLRPTVLDLGLVPALHWLTDDFKGVGFQFDLALPEDILLNDEVSTFLFRAAREALLNVALHAAATHIHVSLNTVAGVCRLAVRDNGCGFDPAAPQREGRFGLIRLIEQARHLGGDLSIDSRPDQGTVLEFHVPAFPKNRSPFSK